MAIIQQKQKINFFKKLYTTYGLGKTSFSNLYLKYGLNLKTKPKQLKKKIKITIEKHLSKKCLGRDLKQKIKSKLAFYARVRTCKSMRYGRRYPIRGQRTRTNAKTARKNRFRL